MPKKIRTTIGEIKRLVREVSGHDWNAWLPAFESAHKAAGFELQADLPVYDWISSEGASAEQVEDGIHAMFKAGLTPDRAVEEMMDADGFFDKWVGEDPASDDDDEEDESTDVVVNDLIKAVKAAGIKQAPGRDYRLMVLRFHDREDAHVTFDSEPDAVTAIVAAQLGKKPRRTELGHEWKQGASQVIVKPEASGFVGKSYATLSVLTKRKK